MEKYLDDIIVMKVGPHSGMSLQDIISSKNEEEKYNGVHYWGYSGVFCRPLAVQEFCINSKNKRHNPKIVLLETKSSYDSKIGFIKKYSEDGINYKEFKAPVQLQGAEFSFVAKNLREESNFKMDNFKVVGGKNDGKPLSNHLKFRVNKCFATYDKESKCSAQKVYIADLVEPYAIWLK